PIESDHLRDFSQAHVVFVNKCYDVPSLCVGLPLQYPRDVTKADDGHNYSAVLNDDDRDQRLVANVRPLCERIPLVWIWKFSSERRSRETEECCEPAVTLDDNPPAILRRRNDDHWFAVEVPVHRYRF